MGDIGVGERMIFCQVRGRVGWASVREVGKRAARGREGVEVDVMVMWKVGVRVMRILRSWGRFLESEG